MYVQIHNGPLIRVITRFTLYTQQQTEQVNVVGANVEVGGDSDSDSDGGYVIDENAAG